MKIKLTKSRSERGIFSFFFQLCKLMNKGEKNSKSSQSDISSFFKSGPLKSSKACYKVL